MNTVAQCTALDLLAHQPDASVSLFVTDPPYGIGYKASTRLRIPARDNRRYGKRHLSEQRVAPRSFGRDDFDPSWLCEAYRVTKEGGALYLFTRWDVLHLWQAAIESAGFKVVQRIIWDKCLWGAGDLRYYGSQIEDILFCVKGPHLLRWDKREGNVWKVGRGRITGKDGARHPTQKPVDLLMKAIERSSQPGDLVCDPFCGSGSTLVAAQRLKRNFIGCDIQRQYVDVANAWLADERQHNPDIAMEYLV